MSSAFIEKAVSQLNNPFRSHRAAFVFTLLLAVLIYIPMLDVRHFSGSDEPRVAAIGAEMERTGDWVVPRLNGTPFLEIPQFYWWTSAASFSIFGESTASAKLPSALAAIGAVLCVFLIAKGTGLPPLGCFIAGMILATAPQFWAIGRRCIMDMVLCFWIAFSLLSFFSFVMSTASARRALWAFLFWGGLSCALMTKGIVGLGIPCAGLFFWLVARKEKNIFTWAVLFGAAALSLIPISIWLWMLNERAGFDAVKTVVWDNNIGRFVGSHPDHNEPFYYYFEYFPLQLMPWTLFAFLTIYLMITKKLSEASRRLAVFSGLCVIVPFAILLIASGKRAIYLLPLFPPVALFAAASFEWVIGLFGEKNRFRVAASFCLLFMLYACGMLVGEAVKASVMNKYSYEPLYRKCAAMLKSGECSDIILYKAEERIRGGTFFFLKRHFPEEKDLEQLRQTLLSGRKITVGADGKTVVKDSFIGVCESASMPPYAEEIQKFRAGKKFYISIFRLKPDVK